MHTLPSFSAVILAGGQSSRMGRDKAFLRMEGETLLQRQLRTAAEAGAAQLLISGRADADYSGYNAEVLYDEAPSCGPLGGIISGFRAARHALILVLAVDMPCVTSVFLRKLLSRCSENGGIAPAHLDGMIEPLAAFYPRALCAEALRLRDTGFPAPRRLIHSALATRAMTLYTLEPDEVPQLISCNAPCE
ncbi:MAG: molybdenum cofactor guanylyltransferase [Spartobacteria bacterium]|nr:molybdenum cofactor guanylyltransferase [Spartobacteria bacterium]